MAVKLIEPTHVHSIAGVRLATASAGIRYIGRDDVVLVEIAQQSNVAAVFTQNKFCAAPVKCLMLVRLKTNCHRCVKTYQKIIG